MTDRPRVRSSYREERAIFDTPAKRRWFAVVLVGLVALPFLLSAELNLIVATLFASAIAAIGLNLVSGYAGQLSLGHAFFIGVGAYTAAILSGPRDGNVVGLGVTNLLVWLPAAGLVAALIGALVAPVATRVRGLYLAIVTLGLVFVGEHVFREARPLTGGAGVGRSGPTLDLFGVDLGSGGTWAGLEFTRERRYYFLALLLLTVMALLAANLVRSRTGRAFAAVRDRDIAADVMGVHLTRTKIIAFTVSSFYAGITGALTAAFTGFIEPTGFSLLLSITYVAMILIGGISTIAGSILGAAFVILLPRFVQDVPDLLPIITAQPVGGFLTTFQLEQLLYGGLIVAFVILEPRGLHGLWVRIRNYWKAWPFSY